MKVAIIGAGIGGLTTALALKKHNIPFTIFEAAAELKPVGAGIILANNAMQVFRNLGIHTEIERVGNPLYFTTLSEPDFSPLTRVDLKPFEQQFGVQNHTIHRAELHKILIEAVGEKNIKLNKRLKNVANEKHQFLMKFEDGAEETYEYLIGADGIKSKVRSILFNYQEYRDSGQLCWRGVTEFEIPKDYRHELVEAWGKSKRFGFVPLRDNRVYWYLLIDKTIGALSSSPLEFAGDFIPMAEAVMRKTPEEKIIATEIYDLKPYSDWSQSNVCLIGDAAHATTPNLGQGACQAIEDAHALYRLLSENDLKTSIQLYPKVRLKKAHSIVNKSWQVGKIAHWSKQPGIFLRNALMRATPHKTNQKMMLNYFRIADQ
ncbi:FAD-dependent monooxygenase [Sphingobacterium paucimobilis]|uniref:FAD-binding domain-containing protein n=1 Tax=Sphingobacterium paucimobilis HER1398 TaxID=1346330 RepID=U2HUX3_9SPHI|nr:FAD-dependent monooxygenase [Sphingobacterium paucimobilis]ERJ59060.1 hypothetical protein M472_09780 [Sphingobacterium paucimobilis HER1398]